MNRDGSTRCNSASQADTASTGILDPVAAASDPMSRGLQVVTVGSGKKRNEPIAPRYSPAIPVQPPPTPGVILNLPNGRDIRRARSAWKLAWLLYDVFNRWAAWFAQWEATDDADPRVPVELQDEALTYFIGLWRLGVNSGSFVLDSDQATEFLKGIFPPLPNSSKATDWRRDRRFRRQVKERLQSRQLVGFLHELKIIMRMLNVEPSLAFSEVGELLGDSPNSLEDSLKRLKRASVGTDLIRFLANTPGQRAQLRVLVQHLYGENHASTRTVHAKAKQLIRRTAASLDQADAPLRLGWNWNEGHVWLSIRSGIQSTLHDVAR
jgi:hypothetical protein